MSFNLKTNIDDINFSISSLYYAKYLQGVYGVEVDYKIDNEFELTSDKVIADWQIGYDCDNLLCIQSRTSQVTVTDYAVPGISTLPQVNNCLKFTCKWTQ